MHDVPLHLCFPVISMALHNTKSILLKKCGLIYLRLSSVESAFWEKCKFNLLGKVSRSQFKEEQLQTEVPFSLLSRTKLLEQKMCLFPAIKG